MVWVAIMTSTQYKGARRVMEGKVSFSPINIKMIIKDQMSSSMMSFYYELVNTI